MAVPKKKKSHASTASRKAVWLGALRAPSSTACTNCGEVTISHRACSSCGQYRKRQVLKVKEDAKA